MYPPNPVPVGEASTSARKKDLMPLSSSPSLSVNDTAESPLHQIPDITPLKTRRSSRTGEAGQRTPSLTDSPIPVLSPPPKTSQPRPSHRKNEGRVSKSPRKARKRALARAVEKNADEQTDNKLGHGDRPDEPLQ